MYYTNKFISILFVLALTVHHYHHQIECHRTDGLHKFYQSKLAANQTSNVNSKASSYKIGFGIGDITGPAAEINMMGYAKIGQDTKGIHMRLYSRAVIIADQTGSRICYVNVDLASTTQIVKILVIEQLEKLFGIGVYGHENVMIGATHTHSGPGGYFQYLLYIITQEGYINNSITAITEGIVKSISDAHYNLRPGQLTYNKGELLDTSVNRSPASYIMNPNMSVQSMDYIIINLFKDKAIDTNGTLMGIIDWFAVHGTSMNNTNKLISSDNKGYAAMRYEEDYNGRLRIGKGPFVAIFAQANEGDSSPNTKGARCLDTGLPCDFIHGTCNNKNELCVASGPGKDMFESTKIIGERQYEKAKELAKETGELVQGRIRYVYQNINMTERTVNLDNNTMVKTCAAALGYSFAAGTSDGEGAQFFQQGTKLGDESKFFDFIRNIITKPSEEILECQKPKAVLLPVGEMKFPYQWTPEIMPTQMFEIGDLVLVGLPAEFTTMSGRRIREDIEKIYEDSGRKVHVILSGLVNSYSNYVTTYEEYQLQRYEGGSTLFGQYTLHAYRDQFKNLAKSLTSGETVSLGPKLPNFIKTEISLKPGVLYDWPISKYFGEVLTDALEQYYAGSRVKVKFCGANPRNNLHLEGTFLTVERLKNGTQWEVQATDAHWETMFIWNRNSTLLGTSEVTVMWDIPLDVEPGTYRIRYFGDSKSLRQKIEPFVGETRPFQVRSLSEFENEIYSFVKRFDLSQKGSFPSWK
ncbi:hypothetical protein RDWZM_007500 [Blomia tropicalis]|uniref:Neutral ceramidase n=1 Tax=Blomia tropicalis TaxID=40697 RepID=A0A9Q0M0B3_BLOTA|nr:hypothetical protein RDWZM_007500 [Blomia tropicalis]